MRIIVNDISASRGGALTILKQLYSYVIENDKTNEWIFLLQDRFFEETKNVRIIPMAYICKNRCKKVLFILFGGRRYINDLKPDVVVSLQNLTTFGVKAPQAVYIHQSLPYQTVKKFSFLKKEERTCAVYQYLIGFLIHQSAKKADKVIVQSEWMKAAVISRDQIPEGKIINAMPNYEVVKKPATTFRQNVFFYPTNSMSYKNYKLIEKACCILNKRGIVSFKVKLTLPNGTVVHPNIECIGEMKKDDVMNMYYSSTLIFPSYVETVGLPLMEAKGAGTVILASDTPFAHEILDDYMNVCFFDLFDADTLASQMEAVISGEKTIMENSVQTPIASGWIKVYDFIMKSEEENK